MKWSAPRRRSQPHIILAHDSSKPACDHNNLNLAGSCYISSFQAEKNSKWLSGEGFERQTSMKHYQKRLGTLKGKCHYLRTDTSQQIRTMCISGKAWTSLQECIRLKRDERAYNFDV